MRAQTYTALTALSGMGCAGPSAKVVARTSSLTRRKNDGLRLLKEFMFTMPSTWTKIDNNGCHTWRAWGSRECKKQYEYIMEPRDLRFTTWYLNKVRLRTWDHFPVVVKIEGKDLRTKNGVKSWAGWICERGVVGQRARLLIRRSAQGILLRQHPHGRGKGGSQSSGGSSRRWERQMKSAKRGSKRDQTHRRMTHG